MIKGFIVDFYCHKAALVIEVDGTIHDEEEQRQRDTHRETVLKELGLRVIRFRNEEIQNNPENVIERIKGMISP